MLRDHDVLLDSSWEALVWGACSLYKIPVERVDRSNAIEGEPGHYYAPDLYLPNEDIWLEVKGLQDEDDPAKWEVWGERVGRLVVVDEGWLKAMCRNPLLGIPAPPPPAKVALTPA